jgi:hypothetical protein
MQACKPFGKVPGGRDIPVVTFSSFGFAWRLNPSHRVLMQTQLSDSELSL